MEAHRFYDGQELKEQMRAELGRPSKRVSANWGEGGAILENAKGRLALQTTLFVEEIHFDLADATPREVGHKALAAALSALAALGAAPLYATMALGLRQEQGEIFVAEVMAGAARLAQKCKIDLVAETSVPSPSGTTVSVTVVGDVVGKAFSPAGAKPGDRIVVSGSLGMSAAGLALIKRLGRSEAQRYEEAMRAHLLPEPRNRESAALREAGGIGGVVDLRDGLTRDLYRLAEHSGVGAMVDEGSLPISKDFLRFAQAITSDPRAWMLYGGEDFALLFTVAPKHWPKVEQTLKKQKLGAAVIGEIRPAKDKVKLKTFDGDVIPLLPKVWSHFARRSKSRWR